jgi:adenosyl cobinamide kinase/adenosyl cobinamide phosphate guanylyltransferase
METIKQFSKVLLSLQMLLLIMTTLMLSNLTALGQSEDLSKRNKILELTIDDLKQENRNCVIMNQVLGDEVNQSKDSLSNYRARLSELENKVSYQETKINSLKSQKSKLIWIIFIILSLIIAVSWYLFKEFDKNLD